MRIVLIALLTSFIAMFSCDSPPSQGEQLYNYYCANCHMPEGTGLVELIPPVADSDYLKQHWDDLACLIRNGQEEMIVVNGISYNEPMPGNDDLTQTEIINIISYIRTTWYADLPEQSPALIRSFLDKCTETQ